MDEEHGFLLFKVALSIFFCFLSWRFYITTQEKRHKKNGTSVFNGPKSYPILGSALAVMANSHRFSQWVTDLIKLSPTQTIVLKSLGGNLVLTANPDNVEYILKTNFPNYPKGHFTTNLMEDFLGQGIFNSDGDLWKIQRKVASHEFNTRSLRKFIHQVVRQELCTRLIPLLDKAAIEGKVLDLQDVLQRFAFDNISKISFGMDPCCLDPGFLPDSEFMVAFEKATQLAAERFRSFLPWSWRIRRFFGAGYEKELRASIEKVKSFAEEVIRKKMEKSEGSGTSEVDDLLSRFMDTGMDKEFIVDIVINFILAGRDTTSAALTWFFWLLERHPQVEEAIIQEIGSSNEIGMDEVKQLNYLHAALCESMRLYPPVPNDSKEAATEDVLPDGTKVSKGTRVSYNPYAMGRMEGIWGKDFEEFRPERWLDKESGLFVPVDSFKYPVFQAGPRVCLGKEMAFLQMKGIVCMVLKRFKIRMANSSADPVFITNLTAKMEGGFPVRIEKI
ncbi:hypothetical protein AMTRI_Chr03g54260 [Amborella trichopoda]